MVSEEHTSQWVFPEENYFLWREHSGRVHNHTQHNHNLSCLACRRLYQEKWYPTELKQRCELALHEYSDPLVFRSSILVLQYSILCEFLRKKIASFITLSVSLYSKQMLHRKVILTWPRAIITNTWCNNFSFISFYGCEGFYFPLFFFFGKSFSSMRI